MSSRQEEKERRRREREEREQAQARKAASRRRLQLVAGGVIALVAIAAVVAAIISASGGNDDKGGSMAAKGDTSDASYKEVSLPARKTSDFDAAIKAAGCTYKNYPNEGRTHLPSDTATNDKYKTNPPTSGAHRPTPAEDGAYAPDNTPDKENYVHTLEHGRIELQYSPNASQDVRNQLFSVFNEKVKGVEAYHMMLFQNNTNMPYEVAATAWTQLLGCKTVNANTWDAIRAFRDRFVDKGPEIIP
jgi:hypothetical protein